MSLIETTSGSYSGYCSLNIYWALGGSGTGLRTGYVDDKAQIIGRKKISSRTLRVCVCREEGGKTQKQGKEQSVRWVQIPQGEEQLSWRSNSAGGDQENLPRGGDFEVALKGELGFGS